MSKIFSPFADGSIVEPKGFVGRRDIIEKFEPYLKDSINGNPNYFLTLVNIILENLLF